MYPTLHHRLSQAMQDQQQLHRLRPPFLSTDPSAQHALSSISTLCKHGRIHDALLSLELMHQQGLPLSSDMMYFVIQACSRKKDLLSARRTRTLIDSAGLGCITFLKDNLIRLFALCGSLHDAYNVFSHVLKPTIYTWNSIISAFTQCGEGQEALSMYGNMKQARVKPDKVTFLSIMQACASIGSPMAARRVHDEIITDGLEFDVNIGNTLLAMYTKCWSLKEARHIFNTMPSRDVVTWSALIAGYAAHDYGIAALELFEKMQRGSLQPNVLTFSSAMKACGSIGDIDHGCFVHDMFVRSNLKVDLVVASTLIDMYNRCGSTKDARKVFNDLRSPDIVSWGAMILGYTMQEDGVSAIELFEKMEQQSVKPNRPILLCAIKACRSLRAVGKGKLVHNQVVDCGLESDVAVGSALTDMYVKCGNLREACQVFNRLGNPDAVLWGALVAGYAAQGNCTSAWQCLEDMQQRGLRPGDAVFTSILTACGNAGLLEDGHSYFQKMSKVHGVVPTIEHLSCLVDLLARTGQLQDAEAILSTMPFFPDAILWRSLLTCCKTYSNPDVGKRCFDEARMLDPEDASIYALMSNMFAGLNRWEDVDYVENLRKCVGAQKMPGIAWIEVGNKVHQFIVSGEKQLRSHPIFAKFCRMTKFMKDDVGFVPQSESVLSMLEENIEDVNCE